MEEIHSSSAVSTPLASLLDRFLGILIDGLVFLAVYYLLDSFLGWGISYIIAAVYYLIRDALPFLNGQSLGKKVMKTKAVKQDSGEPLTGDYGTSLLRNVTLIIPVVGLIDAIFVLIGPERQRLGDRIAKTMVIKE